MCIGDWKLIQLQVRTVYNIFIEKNLKYIYNDACKTYDILGQVEDLLSDLWC